VIRQVLAIPGPGTNNPRPESRPQQNIAFGGVRGRAMGIDRKVTAAWRVIQHLCRIRVPVSRYGILDNFLGVIEHLAVAIPASVYIKRSPRENNSRFRYHLDPRPLPKSKGLGKGLEGKGHGSDKGPTTVATRVLGRSGCHPLRLVSTSYVFPVSCHGRGRGFECGADGQIC
jgi:hypothetical protein